MLTDAQLAALLPAQSNQTISVTAAGTSPQAIEGQGSRGQLRSTFVEEIRGTTLLSREVIRDENGVVEIHVIWATPLSEQEYSEREAAIH